jgi:hypothetical protein
VSRENENRGEPGYRTAGDKLHGVVNDGERCPRAMENKLSGREVHDVERKGDEGVRILEAKSKVKMERMERRATCLERKEIENI